MSRNAEWREENGFHILYLDYPEERYIIDLENEAIRKEYFLMDTWEENYSC